MVVKFLDCGALWMREDKSGETSYSGKLDKDLAAGTRLWISRNNKRANDRQPAHRLSIINEDGPQSSDSPEPSRWARGKPAFRSVKTKPRQQLRMQLPTGRRSGPKTSAGVGSDLCDEVPF